MKLIKHLLVVPGMILLLATLCLAECLLKSGDTTPEIDVVMWNSSTGATCAKIIDPNDVTVRYHEEGEAWESYSDAIEKTSATAAWVSKACLSSPTGDVLTVCLPADAADGGIGKYLTVRVITPTYEGTAHIKLGAPVDAYLSDGTTPPDINVSSGIVEANIKEIEDVEAGLDEIADAVLDEALSGHTTAGTTGKAISDILADTGTDGVVLKAAGLAADAALEIWAGPNYANASTELDGAVEGTSLSTTTTIYLTATSAANDKQYQNRMFVIFADPNGVYQLGEIEYYDDTADVIYLKTPVPAAPANLTPIYVFETPTLDNDLVAPPSGGVVASGTIRAICPPDGSHTVYVQLAELASGVDDAYTGMYIVFYNDGLRDDYARIADYYGSTEYDGLTRVAVLDTPYPSSIYTVASTTTYDIQKDIPTSEAAGFGSNAKYAQLEKDGAVGGVSLSTSTTIYMETDLYDTTLYAAGNIIRFLTTSSGIYSEALIESNTGNVLTISGAVEAPANATPIYSLGKNFAYVPDGALTEDTVESSFFNPLLSINPKDVIDAETDYALDTLAFMLTYPQFAAQLAGMSDWEDSAYEYIGNDSTTTTLYILPVPSTDYTKWSVGKQVLVDVGLGAGVTAYSHATIQSASFRNSDSRLTLNITPLIAAPKDQGIVYLLGSIDGDAAGQWELVSDAVASSGSTTKNIVFSTITYFGSKNVLYCPVQVYDLSGDVLASAICVGYDSTSKTLRVHPSLPFTPAAGDTVKIKRDFGGLIPTDIYKYSGR